MSKLRSVDKQLREQAVGCVRHRVWEQIGRRVSYYLRDDIRDYVGDRIWDQVRVRVRYQVVNQTADLINGSAAERQGLG